MKKCRDRGMPIYHSARPQALTPLQAAVYLLNRAFRSELVRRQEVAPPRYGVKGVRGCNSSLRSRRVKGLQLIGTVSRKQGAAPPIYVHEKYECV